MDLRGRKAVQGKKDLREKMDSMKACNDHLK